MKRIKNKISIISIMVLCAIMLAGCGQESTGKDKADVTDDSSKLYSQKDMESAIALINKEFDSWKGCELHSISYAGDECNSKENIAWMNNLASANDIDEKLTQCIQFVSEFHSPKNEKDAGAWNVDQEYTNWSWWLGRTDNGEWHLLTWGY